MFLLSKHYFNLGTLAKEIAERYRKRRNPKNYQPTRTALDDIASLDRLQNEDAGEQNVRDNTDAKKDSVLSTIVSKDHYDYSSDSSGEGTRFAKRTGNFDLDFPESPKVSKMKGNQVKKSTKNLQKLSEDTIANNNRTASSDSESDTVIQPFGVPIKQQDSHPDSSDVLSETAESSMENITMKRGRHLKKRGNSNYKNISI